MMNDIEFEKTYGFKPKQGKAYAMLPDGSVAEYDAGMSDEEINSKIKAAQAPRESNQYIEDPNYPKFTQGNSDDSRGSLALTASAMGTRDKMEADKKRDYERGLAQMAGSLTLGALTAPLAAAPGGQAAPILASALGNATGGQIYDSYDALVNGKSPEPLTRRAADAAIDAGSDALFGKATDAVMVGAGKIQDVFTSGARKAFDSVRNRLSSPNAASLMKSYSELGVHPSAAAISDNRGLQRTAEVLAGLPLSAKTMQQDAAKTISSTDDAAKRLFEQYGAVRTKQELGDHISNAMQESANKFAERESALWDKLGQYKNEKDLLSANNLLTYLDSELSRFETAPNTNHQFIADLKQLRSNLVADIKLLSGDKTGEPWAMTKRQFKNIAVKGEGDPTRLDEYGALSNEDSRPFWKEGIDPELLQRRAANEADRPSLVIGTTPIDKRVDPGNLPRNNNESGDIPKAWAEVPYGVKDPHEWIVRKAIEQGENVPREVVAGYKGQQWADDFLQSNPENGVPYITLKRLKSKFGGKIADIQTEFPSFNQAEKEAVYGALTNDIEKAFKDSMNPQAIKDYETAKRYTRINKTYNTPTIDDVLNKTFDEDIYSMLLSKAKEGGGRLSAIKRNMPADKWDSVVGSSLYHMGGPEDKWSAATFLTNWRKLSPEAQHELVGGSRYASLTPALEKLEKVIESQAKVREIANRSQTGSFVSTFQTFMAPLTAGIASGAQSGAGAGLGTAAVTAAGTLGGQYGAAKLMTSPRFVNWLAEGANPKMAKDPAIMKRHMLKLALIAEMEPDIKQDIYSYMGSFGGGE